jgi:hypothetical protein
MPHLKRRDRNQRLAIVAVILFMGIYLVVVRPLFAVLFPPPAPKKAVFVPAKRPGPKKGR